MFGALLAQVDPYLTGTRGVTTVGASTWGDAIVNSLANLWIQLGGFLPNLVAAVVVFLVGWAIAMAAGRVVEKVLVVVRVNQAFERLKGLKDAVERAGLSLNMAMLVGEIVKWFLIVVTLLAATDILQLNEVSIFLTSVLLYIPNVAVATLIMIIAVVLANFVYRTVEASVAAARFESATIVAAVAKWAIIIFAILAALTQLNVAVTLIQTIVTAFFAMLALAGGLAFGLGGKEMAARWLDKFEKDLRGRGRE